MAWKFRLALCVYAIAAQVALAQNSVDNLLTGDVKVTVLQRYSGPRTLPKPGKVLVHDFAVPVGVIRTDESIAGQLHRDIMLRHGVDEDSSPEVAAQQVQAAFAKALAEELKKVNIQTVNIPTQGTSAGESTISGADLVIDGDFTAINEGDETKRIVIGFGRGASDIRTHVKISSVTQGHPTVVLEFNLSSESGKKPGAAATMGVGSLAVGAAAGGVSDRKSTVEADASRMGKLVAKQLEAFMAEQKWIAGTHVCGTDRSTSVRSRAASYTLPAYGTPIPDESPEVGIVKQPNCC
jgi:Domain of unknown function (DUF4410)